MLQAAFFKLSGIIPIEDAVKYMKAAIVKSYSKKGDAVGTITLRDEFGNVRTAELIAAKDAAVQAWVIYAAAGLIAIIAAVCIALRKRSRAK